MVWGRGWLVGVDCNKVNNGWKQFRSRWLFVMEDFFLLNLESSQGNSTTHLNRFHGLFLILTLMPLQCLSILAHMCMKLTYTTPSAYHQLWALAEKVKVKWYSDRNSQPNSNTNNSNHSTIFKKFPLQLSHMRTDSLNNWIQLVNLDIFPQTFRLSF